MRSSIVVSSIAQFLWRVKSHWQTADEVAHAVVDGLEKHAAPRAEPIEDQAEGRIEACGSANHGIGVGRQRGWLV
jgi:ABC-type cobalt transport system substrate-binding protein